MNILYILVQPFVKRLCLRIICFGATFYQKVVCKDYMFWCNLLPKGCVLAFPPRSTFNTRHKCRHWLIRRTSLQLVITAFLRLTFSARKSVC